MLCSSKINKPETHANYLIKLEMHMQVYHDLMQDQKS